MGLFDFFKKKKTPDYDPNNMKITQLKKGFVLEYDLKNWEVTAEYEYDWGGNFFSKEYKLDSGDQVLFLTVVEDDELYLYVTEKIRIRNIDDDLPEYINRHEEPPSKVVYNGKTFYRDSESDGYFRDTADKEADWARVISWDYFDESEKEVLFIEQWGEKEYEASTGKVAEEFEFSNILPVDKD